MLASPYVAIGQPDRASSGAAPSLHAGVTRTQTSRRLWSWCLTIAGRDDDAMAAADGLLDAAEATRNPYTLSLALMAYGFAWRNADPDRALGGAAPGPGDRSRQRQPLQRNPHRRQSGPSRSRTRRSAVSARSHHSGDPPLPRFRQHRHSPLAPGESRNLPRPARTLRTCSHHRRFRIQSPDGRVVSRDQRGDHPPPRCPRRPDLRIACPQGRGDDHRRHGDVRLRPNRPGPSRTRSSAEIGGFCEAGRGRGCRLWRQLCVTS